MKHPSGLEFAQAASRANRVDPRKTPVQARSIVTAEAISEVAIQV